MSGGKGLSGQTVYSPSWREVKAGADADAIEEDWLPFHGLLSSLSYTNQDHQQGWAHTQWAGPPQQSPHTLTHRPMSSLFPDDSILCQADRQVSRTEAKAGNWRQRHGRTLLTGLQSLLAQLLFLIQNRSESPNQIAIKKMAHRHAYGPDEVSPGPGSPFPGVSRLV